MKIGIVVAMKDEWLAIGDALKAKEETTLNGLPLYIAKNHETKVYVIASGVGKVASAMASTLLISKFDVDVLLSSGVAGITSPKIAIGDIFLSSKIVQYDIDTIGLGDPLGFISPIKEIYLAADESLISLFKLLLEKNHINYDIGIIGSGDKFVHDEVEKNNIVKNFGVSCFEMECGALSQVARMNNIPFLAIKSISDNADANADDDYPTNKAFAMKTLTKLFKAYFESLSL